MRVIGVLAAPKSVSKTSPDDEEEMNPSPLPVATINCVPPHLVQAHGMPTIIELCKCLVISKLRLC
jgi:hypothetical protein